MVGVLLQSGGTLGNQALQAGLDYGPKEHGRTKPADRCAGQAISYITLLTCFIDFGGTECWVCSPLDYWPSVSLGLWAHVASGSYQRQYYPAV